MSRSKILSMLDDADLRMALDSVAALRNAHTSLRHDFPMFTPHAFDDFVMDVIERSVYSRALKAAAADVVEVGGMAIRGGGKK